MSVTSGQPPSAPCPSRTHWAALRESPIAAPWHDRGAYNLNLLAIRSSAVDSNVFDDAVVVSYKDRGGVWHTEGFVATTDAGRTFRNDPMNPAGTAVIAPQYAHLSHGLGTHRGRPALRQVGPLAIWRVAAGAKVDFDAPTKIAPASAALNIHDAPGADDAEDAVDLASAGCIVLVGSGMSRVLDLVAKQNAAGSGPRVSLALIDTRNNPIASTLLAWARGES